MKLVRYLAPACLLAAILVPSAPAAAPALAASCTIRASMKAPNHTPKANKNWTVTVTASPRAATHAEYQFLFKSTVVSTQYVQHKKNFTFVGHYTDPLVFPSRAINTPLTLRVVLRNRCGTKSLSWEITTKR